MLCIKRCKMKWPEHIKVHNTPNCTAYEYKNYLWPILNLSIPSAGISIIFFPHIKWLQCYSDVMHTSIQPDLNMHIKSSSHISMQKLWWIFIRTRWQRSRLTSLLGEGEFGGLNLSESLPEPYFVVYLANLLLASS